MKKVVAGIAMLVGFSSAATAQNPIVISCYRGPWKEVIWDRANVVFVESLVSAGYDVITAQGIAESICRDPQLVDHPEEMKDALRTVMKKYPIKR